MRERKKFIVRGMENGRHTSYKIWATDIEDAKGVAAMHVAYKLDKNTAYTIVPERLV